MPDDALTVVDVISQLNDRGVDAAGTLELLDGYERQIEEQRASLENPQAVLDYLAFFKTFVGRAVGECDRLCRELAGGAQPGHVAVLRQLAADSAVEQRRCLQFRDKCINKPLPFEKMRPLLNEISISTRDQLTAFRDFTRAADRLQALVPPPPPPSRSFDRRALFNRLLKRDDDK